MKTLSELTGIDNAKFRDVVDGVLIVTDSNNNEYKFKLTPKKRKELQKIVRC